MPIITIIYVQVLERDPVTKRFPIIRTSVNGVEYGGSVRNLAALEALMERHPRAHLNHRGNAFRQLRED